MQRFRRNLRVYVSELMYDGILHYRHQHCVVPINRTWVCLNVKRDECAHGNRVSCADCDVGNMMFRSMNVVCFQVEAVLI